MTKSEVMSRVALNILIKIQWIVRHREREACGDPGVRSGILRIGNYYLKALSVILREPFLLFLDRHALRASDDGNHLDLKKSHSEFSIISHLLLYNLKEHTHGSC